MKEDLSKKSSLLKKNAGVKVGNTQPAVLNKVKCNSVMDKKVLTTSGSTHVNTLPDKKITTPTYNQFSKGKEQNSNSITKESSVINNVKK